MHGKIVYDDSYNLYFYGLEKLHKFPTDKYARIKKHLINSQKVLENDFVRPYYNKEEVDCFLEESYKRQTETPSWIADCLEISLIRFMPYWLLKRHLCNPMILATNGTLQAARIALESGESVNLSGGYHHASFQHGEGFCIYPDVPIALKHLRQEKLCQRVAIVDLDAHQGNGTARCFPRDENVLMVDVYDADIWPNDQQARQYVDVEITFNQEEIHDDEYLSKVEKRVFPALDEFRPEILFFNAGTDVYAKDPLTHFRLSQKGIIARDKQVFDWAHQKGVPVVMVLSGGYHEDSVEIIAESLLQNCFASITQQAS